MPATPLRIRLTFAAACLLGVIANQARAQDAEVDTQYLSYLEDRHDLPDGFLYRVMMKESGGEAGGVSSKGARGYFGFMPGTARIMGVRNPDNFRDAARGSARYFDMMRDEFNGSLYRGTIAYNWGEGNLRKHMRRNNGRVVFDRLPAQTRDYLRVLGLAPG